jgi:hypothetical protein
VPPISADPRRDIRWITACKVARHLGLTAPSRAPGDVPFLVRNLDAYAAQLAEGWPSVTVSVALMPRF